MKKTFNNPDPGDIAPDDVVVGAIRSPHGWVEFTTTAYAVKGYVHAWILDHPVDHENFNLLSLERTVAPPEEVGSVIEASVIGGNGLHVRMMLVEGEPNTDHDRYWWRATRSIVAGDRVRCSFRPDELDQFTVVDLAKIPF